MKRNVRYLWVMGGMVLGWGLVTCKYPPPPTNLQELIQQEEMQEERRLLTVQVLVDSSVTTNRDAQVVSDPPGIQCGGGDTVCQASFAYGTAVALYASSPET